MQTRTNSMQSRGSRRSYYWTIPKKSNPNTSPIKMPISGERTQILCDLLSASGGREFMSRCSCHSYPWLGAKLAVLCRWEGHTLSPISHNNTSHSRATVRLCRCLHYSLLVVFNFLANQMISDFSGHSEMPCLSWVLRQIQVRLLMERNGFYHSILRPRPDAVPFSLNRNHKLLINDLH